MEGLTSSDLAGGGRARSGRLFRRASGAATGPRGFTGGGRRGTASSGVSLGVILSLGGVGGGVFGLFLGGDEEPFVLGLRALSLSLLSISTHMNNDALVVLLLFVQVLAVVLWVCAPCSSRTEEGNGLQG